MMDQSLGEFEKHISRMTPSREAYTRRCTSTTLVRSACRYPDGCRTSIRRELQAGFSDLIVLSTTLRLSKKFALRNETARLAAHSVRRAWICRLWRQRQSIHVLWRTSSSGENLGFKPAAGRPETQRISKSACIKASPNILVRDSVYESSESGVVIRARRRPRDDDCSWQN